MTHRTPSGPAAAAATADAPVGMRRSRALLATSVVVVALAGLNVARSMLPWDGVWLSVGAAVALLVFARATGLTWAQLGLCRHRLRSGHKWAWIAVGTVALVYLVGILLPITRPAFLDSRYHFGVSQALMSAFVVIPLGTVLMEEVAFRSVLWGMLSRHTTTWRVILISSSLFGLWHVLPSLSFASAHRGLEAAAPSAGAATVLVALGTVVFTALGGVVAGELRRRSGSVLASAGMHWATNALGVLFGLVAWRVAG